MRSLGAGQVTTFSTHPEYDVIISCLPLFVNVSGAVQGPVSVTWIFLIWAVFRPFCRFRVTVSDFVIEAV